MPLDKFMIAPFETGLQTNVRPWLIMDDAFSTLENAYVYRGRLRKRFGSRYSGYGWPSESIAPLYSRLRVQVGTIGAPVSPVPGNIFLTGQQFSAGTQIFTVYQTGTPAAMLSTGPGTGTFNTTTGAFALAGTGLDPATPIWWYPNQPVMGITTYQLGDPNQEPTYAFDTQFAYTYANGYWQRSQTAGVPTWRGDNLNFFDATMWQGVTQDLVAMFVSNFNATVGAPAVTDDPLYSFSNGAWASFVPRTNPNGGAVGTGPFVATCRLIVAFRNRLLLLNTVENDGGGGGGTNAQYVARCRYSANASPFAVNAWYEPNVTDAAGNTYIGGGYIDAYTDEAIIAAEFIRDRLIVFFERSTYELVYTGNEIQPFLWQKINTELGSQSPFSTIPFDKQVLTIGNVGVHACNGTNVERIDVKIPQTVFTVSLSNNDNLRVQGVRDYYPELAYWSYCSSNAPANFVYPNKVLIYNYQNQSWAIFDDCITAFGYLQQEPSLTWQEMEDTWETITDTWNQGTLGQYSRRVVAGNHQGYVFIVDVDAARNANVMQITNIAQSNGFTYLQIFANTLSPDDYIYVKNCQGTNASTLNGQIVRVLANVDSGGSSSSDWIKVQFSPTATVTYTGGGVVGRVSNYNILSKQWNPYIEDNKNVHLQRIEFGVQKTAAGEVVVDYYPSSTEVSMLQAGSDTGALMGTGVLTTAPYSATFYPLERFQSRLWHSVYFQTTGECIQINIYMNDTQMRTPNIAFADLQIEGILLLTQPSAGRLE